MIALIIRDYTFPQEIKIVSNATILLPPSIRCALNKGEIPILFWYYYIKLNGIAPEK